MISISNGLQVVFIVTTEQTNVISMYDAFTPSPSPPNEINPF